MQLGRYDRGRGRWALSWRQCGADLPASIAWQVALGDWFAAITAPSVRCARQWHRHFRWQSRWHKRRAAQQNACTDQSQRNTTEQPRTCGSAQGWDGASAQVSVTLSGCTQRSPVEAMAQRKAQICYLGVGSCVGRYDGARVGRSVGEADGLTERLQPKSVGSTRCQPVLRTTLARGSSTASRRARLRALSGLRPIGMHVAPW